MSIQPKFLSTAIGSMPYTDIDHAIDASLNNLDAPIWPQLPKFGMNEQMEIQYSEGMPSIVIDHEKERMYFDTASDYSEAFANFYEAFMESFETTDSTGDFSSMSISEEYSRGIYALEKRLKAKGGKLPWVKVQVTGPCTFALTIVDENKRAIFYNDEFRDVIVKALTMKCRWLIQKFKPYAENIICFIDEPILSAFGSSTYVSVKREDVVDLLKEMIDAVHADNALTGIHCCGNTEWSILIDAGVDIVNFDAFEYGETIAIYSDKVKSHLERGGMLAWGVVPTSKAIREQSVESLEAQLEYVMDNLASKGIDKKLIIEQAIISPSCGTGSLDPSDADKVFEMVNALSTRMKSKYGY